MSKMSSSRCISLIFSTLFGITWCFGDMSYARFVRRNLWNGVAALMGTQKDHNPVRIFHPDIHLADGQKGLVLKTRG